jgi:hypothetical protein
MQLLELTNYDGRHRDGEALFAPIFRLPAQGNKRDSCRRITRTATSRRKTMTDIDDAVAQLRRAIAQTSNPKDRRISEAMMLLLAAAWGINTAVLIDRTGLPMDFIVGVANRMRVALSLMGGGMTSESFECISCSSRRWWASANKTA